MGYDLPGGADGIYGPRRQQAVDGVPDRRRPSVAGRAGVGAHRRDRRPNTLAHFDMFDPGGTVSSHVPARRASPRPRCASRSRPTTCFMGFDASTSPPSLVVGTTTRRPSEGRARAGRVRRRASRSPTRPSRQSGRRTRESSSAARARARRSCARRPAARCSRSSRDGEGRARARRQLLLRLTRTRPRTRATTRRRRCSRCASTGSGGGRRTFASRSASSRTSTLPEVAGPVVARRRRCPRTRRSPWRAT